MVYTSNYKIISSIEIPEDYHTHIKIFEVRKCGCDNPQIWTTNDGNRHQNCKNCKWSWTADIDE